VRVAYIIVGLGVGGAEHMLRRLVLAQRAADPELQHKVVSLTTIGTVGTMLRDAGVDVIALGMRSPLGAPAAVVALWRLLRDWQPDLVQTWMVHADLLGGLAARAAGIRALVWGVRTTDFSINPRATRAVRWLCARLSSTLPHTIVCAAEAARRSHMQAGYDASRMVVIANGFDLLALQPVPAQSQALRERIGVAPGQLVVGMVGRFDIAKDHGNFVAAAGRIAAARADLRFVLVGRGVDESNPVLTGWIGATGHAGRFALLGERSDIAACLGAMDVFVLPSRAEAFPNVVGEAMAIGLPCVVTDVGDAALLLGDSGRVVPARDAEALAAAVLALAALPEDERRALGARARSRIAEHFSLRSACRRFTELQRAVVSDVQRLQQAAR
jgi:glycosyltransferase involved in cell wall biosynthesis